MAAPMHFARFGLSVSDFLSFSAKYNNAQGYQTLRTFSCCGSFSLGRKIDAQWTNNSNTDGLLCGTLASRGRDQRQSPHDRRQLSTCTTHEFSQNTCILGRNYSAKHILHRGLLGLVTCPLYGGISARGYRGRRVSEFGLEDAEDAARRPGSGLTQAEKEDHAFHKGFMLRTAFENGFLSWTRNTYIMTVAGVTMYNQLTVPFAQEAAVVILMAGGVNMIAGTGLYIYHLVTRRRHMYMSGMMSFMLSGLSIFHLMLWMGAIMVYLGYVEEDPNALEEELREAEERYLERRKRVTQGVNKYISDKYD